MKQNDIFFHGRGETLYADDLGGFAGLLHAAVLPSPVARGRLLRLDVSAALRLPGVAAVVTAGLVNVIASGFLPSDDSALRERKAFLEARFEALRIARDIASGEIRQAAAPASTQAR